MKRRPLLIAILLLGVLILAAHQQHPLVPKDAHGDLGLKCSACLIHGKVVVSVSAIPSGLTITPEYVSPEAPMVIAPRTVATVPSRAPPVS